MPIVNNQSQVNTPVDIGGANQVALSNTELQLELEIAAGSETVSPVILSGGFKNFALSLQASKSGQIKIQRYLDAEGTIPQGAELTVSIIVDQPTVLNVNDDKAFQSFIVTVTNTSGSESTITANSVILLMQSY